MTTLKARRSASRRAVAAMGVLAAVAALAACSVRLTPDDASASPTQASAQATASARPDLTSLDVLADPAAFVGPSTATLVNAAIEAVATDPKQTLPATVVSHPRSGDVPVTVTDTSRVVAMDLSGSIASTVWGLGLGDTLVGRDEAASFPGVEQLPVVTGASHTISPEAILALEPTLVITDGSLGPSDAIEQLQDAGVTVVTVTNDPTFAGAEELARQVAAVLGVPAQGEALANRIAGEVDAVRSQIQQILPADGKPLRMAFVYLRGSAGIYYLFGKESGADQLIAALGGVDAADDAGIEGMKPLTDEAMVAANPDVILVMTDGLESVGGVDGLLASKPAIALTSAGQHRRIVDMDDREILAFGPRSAQILDALARAIYAPESTS